MQLHVNFALEIKPRSAEDQALSPFNRGARFWASG